MPGRIKWCDYPVDFDSRISDRTDGDGERDPLQQREVDVDVEPLRLIAGETGGDALKRLADRVQMVQSFAQAEVGEGPSSRSFCLLVGLRLKSVISYTPRALSSNSHHFT